VEVQPVRRSKTRIGLRAAAFIHRRRRLVFQTPVD
jgi:hypothetical protein